MNPDAKGPTRRAVLITIGGAASVVGLPGLDAAGPTGSPVLPPGVYLPSRDDLAHVLMSSGRFPPIPPGCPTDYIRPPVGPFTPLFFSAAEFAVIRRLTELLLGESASSREGSFVEEVAEWIDLRVASAAGIRAAARSLDPANRSLAVAYFGADKVIQVETANPEKICRDGLIWLSERARAQGSAQFPSLPEQQQLTLLTAMSDERPDTKTENAGTRFFTFLKAEVIFGFYTSQAGLKEVDFKGNTFYARSPGCDLKAQGT